MTVSEFQFLNILVIWFLIMHFNHLDCSVTFNHFLIHQGQMNHLDLHFPYLKSHLPNLQLDSLKSLFLLKGNLERVERKFCAH